MIQISGDLPKHGALSPAVFIFCFLAWASPALANNVSIENAELTGRDSNADTIKIEFDISWSNAWYDSINKDAVWVFAKYCTSGCTGTSAVWSHVKLAEAGTNPDGFSRGTKQAGSNIGRIEIIVPSDKTGAFIQPAQQGSGTLDFHDVQLVWDYGANGITSDATPIASTTYVRVFGIEMVYIPEGGFYAGDGSAGSADTEAQFEYGDGSMNLPPAVNSEEGISFRASSSDAWYYNSDNSDDDADGANFDLSEAFPKGFNAFYLMKYEITQGQYRDFLNLLTRVQQNNRTESRTANRFAMSDTASVSYRSSIRVPASPGAGVITFGCDLDSDGTFNESNDGEWIAANYINWMDVAAFADWAALRPFTELELEKAARGPLYPVEGEYAWGTTVYTEVLNVYNSGQASEYTDSGTGLVNFGYAEPIRTGFAATASSTTRAAAGAGYYGNLDLSGNVGERIVTVGNAAGRGFSGTHGDGTLTTTSSYEGNATNPDWPGFNTANPGRGVDGAAGSGFRMGSMTGSGGSAYRMEISNRDNAAFIYDSRPPDTGGRLARTSPEYD